MTREERVGLNEAVFREVNERIDDLADTFDLEHLDLVCECGNGDCLQRISMSQSEYERLRSDPQLFAVYPGHEATDVEAVVERRNGYDIVRKDEGAPERIAEATNPRR
jgi:hypothetical protein